MVVRLCHFKSEFGLYLRVTEDLVHGVHFKDVDQYTEIEMRSDVAAGVVTLKGKVSNRYIAMSTTGSLYTTTEICQDCFFIENYKEEYNSYQSKVNPSWYLALRRSGQAKYGPKTNPRQRAVNFLIKGLQR